jgi:hypothetical protein
MNYFTFQDGELPDDVDWSFLFRIQDGEVYRVCPPVNPQLRKKRFHMNKRTVAQADGVENRESLKLEELGKIEYRNGLRSFKDKTRPLCLGKAITSFSSSFISLENLVCRSFCDFFIPEKHGSTGCSKSLDAVSRGHISGLPGIKEMALTPKDACHP